jgi:hypothetical protein
VDLSAGLELEAGIEIGFDAGLSLQAGLGVSLGASVGVEASLEASFGLEISAGAGGGQSSGFALAAAGGVSAALDTVAKAKSEQAAAAAVAAFTSEGDSAVADATAPSAVAQTEGQAAGAAQPAPPQQPREPLSAAGLPTSLQQAEAAPAPTPDRPDTRAVTYGAGVPLRPRVSVAAEKRTEAVYGQYAAEALAGALPPVRTDVTTPPWEELPAEDPGRHRADEKQQARRQRRPCGRSMRPRPCGGCG